MLSFESKGSFKKTEDLLNRIGKGKIYAILESYAEQGVAALAAATPFESGETADGWYYEIIHTSKSHQIIFKNRHVVDGQNIAILIQYGHGTRNGGYVQGRDYINPVAIPLFDRLVADIWKEVIA